MSLAAPIPQMTKRKALPLYSAKSPATLQRQGFALASLTRHAYLSTEGFLGFANSLLRVTLSFLSQAFSFKLF